MLSRHAIPTPLKYIVSSTAASVEATNGYAFGITLINNTDVILVPGTINQVLPDNMFTVQTLTSGSTHYVVLKALSDGKSVTGATLELLTSLTPPLIGSQAGSAPTPFRILLGAIIGPPSSTRKVYQIAAGNVVAIPKQVLLTPKTSVTPGTEPFDRIWSWAVVQRI